MPSCPCELSPQEKGDNQYHGGNNQLSHIRRTYYYIRKFHRSYKKRHRTNTGQQNISGHPLPVQHQEKSKINQSRASLLLQNNTDHRQENQQKRYREVLDSSQLKSIGIHKLGHSQSCSELRKFSRLYTKRTQLQPRMGPLYIGSKKMVAISRTIIPA